MNEKIINEIEKKAKPYFRNASGCHDWSHVERVRNLACRIAKKEKADIFIVEISSILHDLGRKDEMKSRGKICHAEKGAEIAEKILSIYKLDNKTKNNIIHCILSHRKRKKKKPETIEARCLFDADKLDSLGAIGIGRIFLFAGNAGANLLYTGNEQELVKSEKDLSYGNEDTAVLEWELKLRYLKDNMFTREGGRIAQKRHLFMKRFFKQFFLEIEGDR